jgi:hypothetical protein
MKYDVMSTAYDEYYYFGEHLIMHHHFNYVKHSNIQQFEWE